MTDLVPSGSMEDISALPPELQALFNDTTSDDYENSDEGKSLPRIRLMQAMSNEVHEGKFRPGQVVDPVLGHVYLENPKNDVLEFIPLLTYRTRLYFKGRDEGGEMSCRSDDFLHGFGDPGGDCMSCSLKDWGGEKQDRPPRCMEQRNIIMYFPNAPQQSQVGICSFMKTQLKVAKEFERKSRAFGAGRRIFTSAYRFEVFMDHAGSDQFYNWRLSNFDDGKPGKLVTDPDILRTAMAIADGVKKERRDMCDRIAKQFEAAHVTSKVVETEADEELDLDDID